MSREHLAPPLVAHRDAIAALCRRYGVERLEVFGSAADGRFEAARSDIDFIVRLSKELAPGQGSLGRRFVALAEALEALLGRKVDLMPDKPIANPFLRRSVEASRTVFYDRALEQAPA
jgi:predicted nucleotidyltransferase